MIRLGRDKLRGERFSRSRGDHCLGAQTTGDHLSNAEEQVAVRRFPELVLMEA